MTHRNDRYGDWVPPNAPGRGQGPKPSRSYTSAFSYIDSVQKVGELAAATGDKATAAKLAAESTRLAGTFNKQWFNASTSSYDNGVMTTYTLPPHMGIVPSASIRFRRGKKKKKRVLSHRHLFDPD